MSEHNIQSETIHLPTEAVFVSKTVGAPSSTEWNTSNDGHKFYTVNVTFLPPFDAKPVCHIGLTNFDTDEHPRIDVSIEEVYADHVTVKFVTWAGSIIYGATVHLLAIGPRKK